jgi:hypothetical protein
VKLATALTVFAVSVAAPVALAAGAAIADQPPASAYPACADLGAPLPDPDIMRWGTWCVFADTTNTPGSVEYVLIAPDGRGTLVEASNG